MKMLEQMEAKRALEENAALKRTVEDLAHALRKANRAIELGATDTAAYSIRRTLERHGLLRDVDRPEELPDAWKPATIHKGANPFSEPCTDCGAGAWEECKPTCGDRR